MNEKRAFSYDETTLVPGISPIPVSMRQQLQARLQSLSYGAFCLLVRHLLYRSGYSSVHAVGRLYRGDALPRGEGGKFDPKHGGLDLIALSHTDIATSLTLVQVKQYRDLVPRRFVHEVIGTMTRLCAERGLIITTSRFAPLAREAAGGSRSHPIDLIDGPLLVEMLYARRIGLTAIPKSESGKQHTTWVLDASYFNSLEEKVRNWPDAESNEEKEAS